MDGREGTKMKIHAIRFWLFGVCVGMFTGCASYPVSKNLREQAKPLTIPQVASNPTAYKGTVVIWGGGVVQTVNHTNGADIYVLDMPLTRDGRPDRSGISGGRFIAHSQGFVDPQVFKKGKLITVAGTVTGVQTEPLQKIQYTYPVIAIDELHLWHARPAYYSGYWGWYGPGWGWYGPGWGWYGPGWGWGWGWGPGWGWY